MCNDEQQSDVQWGAEKQCTVRCSEAMHSDVQQGDVQWDLVKHCLVRCSEVQWNKMKWDAVKRCTVRCSDGICHEVQQSNVQSCSEVMCSKFQEVAVYKCQQSKGWGRGFGKCWHRLKKVLRGEEGSGKCWNSPMKGVEWVLQMLTALTKLLLKELNKKFDNSLVIGSKLSPLRMSPLFGEFPPLGVPSSGSAATSWNFKQLELNFLLNLY